MGVPLGRVGWITGLLVFAFIGINRWAYVQVEAMTHFSTGGTKTAPPEKLSLAGKIKVLFTGVTFPRPENRQTPGDFQLSFRTFKYPSADTQILEAWSIFHPEPRCVVLMFAGYGASKASLLPEAKRLYDLWLDPFLTDFQGTGGSDGDRTTLGFREAEDVAASFAFVPQIGPYKWRVLYGNSMGAVAVMKAVRDGPLKPDGLILECPFDSLLHTVENRFRLMGLPSFPAAELLVFWGGVQGGFNGFKHNPMDYAASLDCPVLYMSGEKDERVTVEQSKAVFDRIPGTKRFVLFEGAGHQSYAALDGDKWGQSVQGFIQSLSD